MNMIKLPDTIKSTSIRSMPEGRTFYTVPWSMFTDDDGNLFLNGDYTYHEEPGGTVQMAVQKLFGSYTVDISTCGYYSWSVGKPATIDSSDWAMDIPVGKLIGEETYCRNRQR